MSYYDDCRLHNYIKVLHEKNNVLLILDKIVLNIFYTSTCLQYKGMPAKPKK